MMTILRLSYKHISEDKWVEIVRPPQGFECPENIAEAEDFCYDLSDLKYGKQYTSNVSGIIDLRLY